MPQYTFTSDEDFIRNEVDEIAKREKRTRSEMIDILLRQATKERNRKRKKVEHENNSIGNTR